MEQKSEDFLKKADYQYRVKSIINKLFSDALMKTYSKPNPENEYRLENYVLELIDDQEINEIKLHILLKATTIDPFNETRNYWIIKQIIGIACYHRFHVQDFLHQLKTLIPYSSFLWIFLQYSVNSFEKEEWIELFETYNLKNIEEIRKEIDFNLVLKSLPYTLKLKQICLAYAKGQYIEALEACKERYDEKNKDAKKESVLVDRIALRLFALTFSINESEDKCIDAAQHHFSKGHYDNLIRTVANVVSNPQERKKYTPDEWNTLCDMLARSYELTGFINQSVNLYETVFLRLIRSSEDNTGQIDLIFDAIIRLKPKVNFNLCRTDFFKKNINPHTLYTKGLALIVKEKYPDAIILIDMALAFYILKPGLISVECIKCYSALASSYDKLGDIDNATIKCSMAFALASQIYEENQFERLDIEKQLRQFELALAIKQYGEFSHECAEAYNDLGLVCEKKGNKQEAVDAYEKSYEIHTVNFSDDSQIQYLLPKLNQLKLTNFLG